MYTLVPLGQKYSFKLKITNVETAQITGTKIFQVKIDDTLIALTKNQKTETVVAEKKETEQKKEAEPKNIINGDVNITNNNTTTIQGDVYVNMPNGLNW